MLHWADSRMAAGSVRSGQIRNGMLTMSDASTPMRTAKPKPRAKPATMIAVSREKMNGESQ